MSVETTDGTPSRLRRYVRHRFRKPAFVLQARDFEVVTIVSQHRVISSDAIQLLVPGSEQSILRRLHKLFHHGYLDRPRSQRLRGNASMIYALGQRGAEIIAQEAGSKATVDLSEKNRQIGAQFLEHALMISRFQAALRHACQVGGRASVERWYRDGVVRESVNVEHDSGTERIPVAPDAFLTLRLLNEPEGRNRIHVFLEADRGTMTTGRFFAKMNGYWHYWRSGNQEKRLGIRNFLVLTVTATPERATSLCVVTGELDAPKHRGLRMFLFGSERNYTLGEPLRILDGIWRTPGQDVPHGLLE